MANNRIFVVDDGTVELTITNNFKQEICKIHIRPADLSIIDRFNELTEGFADIVEPLKDLHLNNDGTTEVDSEWAKVKEIEKNLIDRLNSVFDSKDIGNLFAKRNAFSTVGGEFYIEKVIEMLGNVVNQEMEAESNKMQKRLEKYTKDLK